MEAGENRVHTTLNLSGRLMHEAQRLFKGKTKTEIIHEALEEKIRKERLTRHFKKWAGKGNFREHG